MEKLFETGKLIDDKIIRTLIKPLKNVNITKIIDAGSGKTSASILLKYFPTAKVDAVVFPGDNRKKNPLEHAIGSDRLNVIEADICKTKFKKQYDFCLIHKSLGEALNFGNHFEELLHNIMNINSQYFLLVEVREDPCVHFRYIEQYWKEKGFEIVKKKLFRNPNPEHYPKVKYDQYKLQFDSKHFIAYLVKKI